MASNASYQLFMIGGHADLPKALARFRGKFGCDPVRIEANPATISGLAEFDGIPVIGNPLEFAGFWRFVIPPARAVLL